MKKPTKATSSNVAKAEAEHISVKIDKTRRLTDSELAGYKLVHEWRLHTALLLVFGLNPRHLAFSCTNPSLDETQDIHFGVLSANAKSAITDRCKWGQERKRQVIEWESKRQFDRTKGREIEPLETPVVLERPDYYVTDRGGFLAWAKAQGVAIPKELTDLLSKDASLSKRAQAISDYIRKNPGCKGETISTALNEDNQYVRDVISKKLKKLGFFNKGAGYFAPR